MSNDAYSRIESIERATQRKIRSILKAQHEIVMAILVEKGLTGPFVDLEGKHYRISELVRHDVEDETSVVLSEYDPENPKVVQWKCKSISVLKLVADVEHKFLMRVDEPSVQEAS